MSAYVVIAPVDKVAYTLELVRRKHPDARLVAVHSHIQCRTHVETRRPDSGPPTVPLTVSEEMRELYFDV